MKCILAAVNHSEPSLRAAELAADIARKFEAALLLLTGARWVASPDRTLEDLRAEHISDPPNVAIADAARAELQALRDRLGEKFDQTVRCDVVTGHAADGIVSFARSSAADLIAIGHVGHGRIGTFVLGSIAQRVIDTAPCPVLVVH